MRALAYMLALLCPLLAGCAIRPAQYAGTPAVRCLAHPFTFRLAVDPTRDLAPGGQAEALSGGTPAPGSEGEALDAALTRAYRSGTLHPYAPQAEPVTNSLLLLSGGSEDGAFGAGFLRAWADQRRARSRPGEPQKQGLPRFRVVTGISTGSLQATFAFLNDPQAVVESYSIARESDLLIPLVSRGLAEQPVRGALALARHGTLARLDPLRAHLHSLLTQLVPGQDGHMITRLEAVAREVNSNEGNRSLMVGAVEMDSGDLVVFDLGEYARAWVAARDGEDGARMRALEDCYVEALIASSSVPMAAPPVFIDGKVFIDGGARFGVFLRPFSRAFAANRRMTAGGRPRDWLYLLINGTLELTPQCTLAPCPHPNPKWRFDALSFRSLAVLINQSYVSSVYWAKNEGRQQGLEPVFARIEQGYLAHRAATGLPPAADEVRSCGEWKAYDEATAHPLEFHPHYMRCLIDYGRHHRTVADWAGLE